MNRFKAAAIVVAMAALVIVPAGAQQTGQAQALLEAARQKETLEGNLASAIRQYQAIVDAYGRSDRLVAATALVRMAECYQKLGDAQARNIYERIMREFGDQADAVAFARTRLGEPAAIAPNAGMVNLQKWTGPRVSGSLLYDVRLGAAHVEVASIDFETGKVLVPPKQAVETYVRARGDRGRRYGSAVVGRVAPAGSATRHR